VKPAEVVKPFGSVAVPNGGSDAASSASSPHPAAGATPTSVPKFDKKSIAKLFQGPSSVSTPPPEAPSPASRSVSLPSQGGQGQLYPPPFASSPVRQGQNGNPSAPRSPVYSCPMTNGQANSVGVGGRLQAGSGGPITGPAPTGSPSLRPTPHPGPGPPRGLSPPPSTIWPPYYVRVAHLFDDISKYKF
jgi:hypothetical protein